MRRWAALLALRRRHAPALDERWRTLALRLELSPQEVPGVPHRYVGRYQGRALELFVARRGWAELRTRVAAPLPAGLHLVHKRTAEVLGLRHLRDTRIGVVPFDDDVIVHAHHAAAAIRLLRDDATRAAVHALLTSQPYTYVVGSDAIVHLPPDIEEGAARAAVRKVCHAAELLEEHARELALEAATQREQRRAEQPPVPVRERSLIPTLTDEERRVVKRAATRRALLAGLGAVPVLAGTGALLIGLVVRAVAPGSSLPGAMWAYTFVGWAVGAMNLAAFLPLYSCPACSSRVVDEEGGPDLAAQACPACGVRLR